MACPSDRRLWRSAAGGLCAFMPVMLAAVFAAPRCRGADAAATRPARIPQYGWRLDGDAFLRLGEGIETPHTKWARPFAGGRVRALFLANKNDAYDVPELARRLDVDVRGMPAETWFRMGEWYWLWLWIEASAGSERAAHFERMLEAEYDVIVLAHFRFLSLTEAVQYKILQRVVRGTGLVLFHRHDIDPRLMREPLPDVPPTLARGTPFAGLDFYREWFMPSRDLSTPDRIGPALLEAATFGRGRVLIVDYNQQQSVFDAVPGAITPHEPYDYTAPVRYDYHQGLAARCVLWAAGRDPLLTWTHDLPDGMEAPALRETSVSIRASWSGGEGERLTRRVRIRNRWGEVLREDEAERVAVRGPIDWELRLPPMPGGWHFVDIIVRSRRGVENWASFAVDVRPAVRIDAIEPVASFFEAADPVRGRVVLSRPPAAEMPAMLDISLEDGYGRVFSRRIQPVEPGSDRIAFEIPQGHVVSWGARLRVRLRLDGVAVHQEEVEIRIRRPDRGEFPIAMWGAMSGYGNHIGNLQMRSLGFTAVIGDALAEARDDLGLMAFGKATGALIHSLGDEISVPRPGRGEALAAFLKTRYATIDALNAAWGTRFASFADAEPAYAAVDGDAGSFVRMHDSFSCGEDLYAENIRRQRVEIEKINPPGVVGPEGSPVGDPERTLPEATFWGPYLADRDNLLVNALGRPGVLRGNWFGGYVEDRQVPTRNRHRLWLSILGGNNMIEYFTIAGGLLAPDLTLMPFTAEFLPAWQEIRRGLGPQLATCRPAGNPVALLHSQTSEHIGRAGDGATDTVRGHEYLLNLLGDAGYSPQYVASGQVRAGRLRQGDVRVLYLVQAFALSEAEVAEILAFAEGGGTVIADILPGGFDERCRIRAARPLDAHFGARGPVPAPSLREHIRRMEEIRPVRGVVGPMLLRGFDDGVVEADTDRPAQVVVRPHGRGRFILLNGVLWKEGREDPTTVAAYRGLIERVAGVRPEFELTWAQPLRKLGTKVYSYRRGDIRIDAVLPPEATDPAIPVRPLLKWAEARHTYDLRREAYVGEVREWSGEVERSAPVVLARLAYRVGAVRIRTAGRAAAGGVVDLTCDVVDAGGTPRPGHVIRIEVTGPDGKERPYYGAWRSEDGPEQRWQIRLALNDPPGRWILRATDVISGATGTATVEIEPGSADAAFEGDPSR